MSVAACIAASCALNCASLAMRRNHHKSDEINEQEKKEPEPTYTDYCYQCVRYKDFQCCIKNEKRLALDKSCKCFKKR